MKSWKRVILGILLLPILMFLSFNLWCLLGARTGLGDWSAIAQAMTATPMSGADQEGLRSFDRIVALAEEPKMEAAVSQVLPFYYERPSVMLAFEQSPEGEDALRSVQESCQPECFPLLFDPWVGLDSSWWSGWLSEPSSGALSSLLMLVLWGQWDWWRRQNILKPPSSVE